jgi:hypothetical protein
LFSLRAFALAILTSCMLVLPSAAMADGDPTGGAAYPAPTSTPTAPENISVPGTVAKLLPDGTAAAPAEAPAQVQQAIWAANTIQDKPYIYGGGHRSFKAAGYDCSGTVSYALHAGGLLDSPLDSGRFMRWGEKGQGLWITVYTNPGHAYVILAGLRLDTSPAGMFGFKASKRSKALERGPRWRPLSRSSTGYKARHPLGF